jgi:capsular exopolysaccharide synthesis family protein
LLVDADLRRPVQHQHFDLPNDAGLADVVAGNTEPPSAILPTAVENLWVMTAGQRPQNPAEILTSPCFEELVNLVREQFDFVLVDTPPLLVVTDPSAVAARVDAVLLVVRLGKSSRNGTRNACNMLQDLGVEVIGTVVNRLDARNRRGRYDGGGYSYGGYAYGGRGYGSSSADDKVVAKASDMDVSAAGMKSQS